MRLNIDLVEAVWIALNLSTLILTASAYWDARADRSAVALLNGHARELAANGIVRREAFRLAIQSLLLLIVVPGAFSDVPTPLNYFVGILMAIPVLLLVSSILDARDRKQMVVLVTADTLAKREDALERIEAALEHNTEISQQASDHADAAYHEANNVNNKIASQGAVLVRQGEAQAESQARGDEIQATGEDTNAKVTDLHDRPG